LEKRRDCLNRKRQQPKFLQIVDFNIIDTNARYYVKEQREQNGHSERYELTLLTPTFTKRELRPEHQAYVLELCLVESNCRDCLLKNRVHELICHLIIRRDEIEHNTMAAFENE
jgi:hypothetical protein